MSQTITGHHVDICPVINVITHMFYMKMLSFNQFLPTVAFLQPIFAHRSNIYCRETDVSWHNGGTSGAPLK